MNDIDTDLGYLVFKFTDLHTYLHPSQIDALLSVANTIEVGRFAIGKPPFNVVILEEGDSEYDRVCKVIEERVASETHELNTEDES